MKSTRKTRSFIRKRLHKRIRKKVFGTQERPRLNISFSHQHIRAQIIDDTTGKTLVGISSLDKDLAEKKIKPNLKGAEIIGKLIAEKASTLPVKAVVFDRGGFKYHGKVKALADAARQAGLEF